MSPILAENAWNDVLPQIRAIAKKLHDLGAKTIVSTGGHFSAANDHFSHREEGGTMREEVLSSPHIASRSTHGTGCAFATAVACQLANGLEQAAAVRAAKEYVRRSIETAYPVGRGTGPVNHLG
jgi:hydroxymethylpyrimidine kinase/phosphomethylpyrimidine kinase